MFSGVGGDRKVVGSAVTTVESANGASRAFNNPAYIWRTSNREVVAVGAERLPSSPRRPSVGGGGGGLARVRTNERTSERARARPRTCTRPSYMHIYGEMITHEEEKGRRRFLGVASNPRRTKIRANIGVTFLPSAPYIRVYFPRKSAAGRSPRRIKSPTVY